MTGSSAPNRLKFLREQAGLSQKEVAIKTGQSKATVNRHEKGNRRLEQRLQDIYASLYGVEAVDLYIERTAISV